MDFKPKKFKCEKCGNETYIDMEVCKKCGTENSVKPIPKECYKCYLNGVFYGSGNINHIHELFKDYVIASKMYSKKECVFRIIKE